MKHSKVKTGTPLFSFRCIGIYPIGAWLPSTVLREEKTPWTPSFRDRLEYLHYSNVVFRSVEAAHSRFTVDVDSTILELYQNARIFIFSILTVIESC